MKASKVLKKAAAEVLRPGGWGRGSYGNYRAEDGPVCATGAIARVVGAEFIGDVEDLHPAWGALSKYCKTKWNVPVVSWNDLQDSPESVAKAMRKVAKGLKERGL